MVCWLSKRAVGTSRPNNLIREAGSECNGPSNGEFSFFLSLLSGGVVDWMFVLGLPADRVSVFLVFSRCTNFYFLITVAVITSLCTQNLCDREPFDRLNNICSGKMMKKCTSSNFQLQNFKF